MTELRNIQADLARFRLRVLIIAIVVVIAFGLIAARLVWLQVFRHVVHIIFHTEFCRLYVLVVSHYLLFLSVPPFTSIPTPAKAQCPPASVIVKPGAIYAPRCIDLGTNTRLLEARTP